MSGPMKKSMNTESTHQFGSLFMNLMKEPLNSPPRSPYMLYVNQA